MAPRYESIGNNGKSLHEIFQEVSTGGEDLILDLGLEIRPRWKDAPMHMGFWEGS